MLAIKNPSRLVLDLEDVDVTSEIEQLPRLVHPGDPYIQSIRVGRFKPGVLRLVLDLKTEVNPQLFALQPFGDYGHRVVLDLYSLTPPDPLMALLESERGREAGDKSAPAPESGRPKPFGAARRPVIIAIDPGHGGEDPGAVGRRGTFEKNVTLAIARRLKILIDAEPGMRAMLRAMTTTTWR
jgi:N-acetylmuramoyl-L-alanine amidase